MHALQSGKRGCKDTGKKRMRPSAGSRHWQSRGLVDIILVGYSIISNQVIALIKALLPCTHLYIYSLPSDCILAKHRRTIRVFRTAVLQDIQINPTLQLQCITRPTTFNYVLAVLIPQTMSMPSGTLFVSCRRRIWAFLDPLPFFLGFLGERRTTPASISSGLTPALSGAGRFSF